MDNHTPTSSTGHKGPGTTSGRTDPEVESASSGSQGSTSSTGNAGGKEGAGGGEVSGKQIRETKKIGEEPKMEESGGSGPIGG